jgi:proline iminopeptidase
VTHFVHHGSFLEDGALLRGIDRLAGIPAAIVQARFDMQSPLGSAWALHRAWPGSRLVVVDNAGHDPSSAEMTSALVDASDRFAQR